jgi:hypothetical protein
MASISDISGTLTFIVLIFFSLNFYAAKIQNISHAQCPFGIEKESLNLAIEAFSGRKFGCMEKNLNLHAVMNIKFSGYGSQ